MEAGILKGAERMYNKLSARKRFKKVSQAVVALGRLLTKLRNLENLSEKFSRLNLADNSSDDDDDDDDNRKVSASESEEEEDSDDDDSCDVTHSPLGSRSRSRLPSLPSSAAIVRISRRAGGGTVPYW